MLFNSLQFVIFFPIVVVLYFNLPYKYRYFFLLASSYYFYMCWKAEYLVLIIISTMVDYFAGIQMGKASSKSKRLKYLLLSIFTNIGLLFSFKYFNFFNDSLRAVFNYYNIFYNVPVFEVLLPVGISFYTFQTLSYSIDVYLNKREPERNPIIFAVYVAFFPQLVAGPIERSTRLLPQFQRYYDFDKTHLADGLRLMLWGFFKKVVIADRLSVVVNQVYANPLEYQTIPLILATYFFAFQIYCDFSGYSDIAIGAARIMGFNLMENFQRPYHAESIREFWKRWHISLSSWFRDYLYIPSGGNRVGKLHWYFNLFIVFLISGLWHGANWTFVFWGALHGFYLLFSIWTRSFRERLISLTGLDSFPNLQKSWKIFYTFHLVLFSWIFFRAQTINEAFTILRNIFRFEGIQDFINMIFTPGKTAYLLGLNNYEISVAVILIIMMETVHLF